jgi:hypothetical protein
MCQFNNICLSISSPRPAFYLLPGVFSVPGTFSMYAYLATSYSCSNFYHFSVLLLPFLFLFLLSFLYLPLPFLLHFCCLLLFLFLPSTIYLSFCNLLSICLLSIFSSAFFIFYFHQPLFLCASGFFAFHPSVPC